MQGYRPIGRPLRADTVQDCRLLDGMSCRSGLTPVQPRRLKLARRAGLTERSCVDTVKVNTAATFRVSFSGSRFPQMGLVHTYSTGIVDQTQHEHDGLTSNQ